MVLVSGATPVQHRLPKYKSASTWLQGLSLVTREPLGRMTSWGNVTGWMPVTWLSTTPWHYSGRPLDGTTPENLNEKLGREENGILTTENPRLLITRQAFRANSVSKWNDLPLELRTENSIGRFKRTLKTWLRERREDNQRLDPG